RMVFLQCVPSCCCVLRRLLPLPLFPYTTLFRSSRSATSAPSLPSGAPRLGLSGISSSGRGSAAPSTRIRRRPMSLSFHAWLRPRSEEHTSELQSRENLVCRLLLEKKKPTLVRPF